MDEPMTRATALALIEDAKRWNRAYDKQCERIAELEAEIEMARQLARAVIELSDYFPPEWDGGDPGYLAGGVFGLAKSIIAAKSPDRSEQ